MAPQIKQRIEQIRRGEVPAGYKKTKVGVVPNEWEETRFKKIFSRLSRKNKENNDNVLTISAQYGLISQRDFFNKDIASEDKSNYFLLHNGEFAYNKSYSNGYPFGALKRLDMYDKGIVSPLYICFSANENNECPDFYVHYFEAGMMNREIQAFAQEGARNHGLLNISVDDFFNSYLLMPPLPEQEKIAEILSAQDNIVDLYERKIEKLEKQKKAFMQKMFPQKGESVPRLRFPQFTDPWEERKFGTMFKRRTERNNGQFDNTRWISVAKMYFQEAEKVSSNNIDTRTYVMRRGDIAFEGHSNTEYKYGRFVANDIGDGVISELFPIYMHIDEYDESYWKYAIQIENIMAPKLLRCIEISYTSSNKLDEDFFLRESVLVPSISEQQQIGLFFRSMDNLIKVNQQKLAQEKQKKKAMMQLLLTGIVRV